MKNITEVALEAGRIFARWDEAAVRDRAFDGGEWSGPAALRSACDEAAELAAAHGFTLAELDAELGRLYAEATRDLYSKLGRPV
jgi:hypothetical protein